MHIRVNGFAENLVQRWTKNLEVYIWVNGISDGRKSTGIEYTRTVSVHNSHPFAAFDFNFLPNDQRVVVIWQWNALIHCFKNNLRVENEFMSGLKVQLHVYLSPSWGRSRSSQPAGWRTGFKCVLSGGGSFGRARELCGCWAAFGESLFLL